MSFSVITVGKWPNAVFRERGSGPPPFVNDFQRGPPSSRREGIQSRLCSHTLRIFFGGMSTYLRTLRDPTGVKTATARALGLAPVFISFICSQ